MTHFACEARTEVPSPPPPSIWRDTLTRVPYGVFQADETYRREQERIFRGPLWPILPRITSANTVAPCVIIGGRAAETLRAEHHLAPYERVSPMVA
jgi:hypothetical protein